MKCPKCQSRLIHLLGWERADLCEKCHRMFERAYTKGFWDGYKKAQKEREKRKK